MDDQLARLKKWCDIVKGEDGDKRSKDRRLIRV
jgi:hypothetical protein